MGLDRDLQALKRARERLQEFPKIQFTHARFDDWDQYLNLPPTRVLVDLGVSSFQLDDPERGFSFRKEGPLDMRMDSSQGETASSFLKSAREEEISDVLWKYGEERRSRFYARKLVHERKFKPLETTKDLVEILGCSLESRDRQGHHPLTRVFQALRIHVNDELGAMERLMGSVSEKMAIGGRFAVITFHSLEDRLVKWTMRGLLQAVNKKVIIPSEDEIRDNPRARSAKLRIFEKRSEDQK
jgi:16S rRNA (cytosine1402-N4)-methyltransferase